MNADAALQAILLMVVLTTPFTLITYVIAKRKRL